MKEDKISLYAIFAGIIAFVLMQFGMFKGNGVLSICAAIITLTMIWIMYDYISMKRLKKLHKQYARRNLAPLTEEHANMEIDQLINNINDANSEPHSSFYEKEKLLDEKNGEVREDADIKAKSLSIYNKETGEQVTTDSKPLYENYQDLAKLNYYNAEGLKCSYGTGLTKYETSDLIGPTKADTFKEAYDLVGCNGDTRIANRMKFQGLKDKMAKDIRVRQDRRSAQKYFGDELNIEERRIWWENPDVYDSVM